MVRPLRYLLDKKYAQTSDPDLQGLPLDALRVVSSKIATKLKAAGITSIPELANASAEQLKGKGLSKKEITNVISYAKDIMTHANKPGIQEGVLPLEELLDKAYEKTPVNELAGLTPEAIQGVSKGDVAKLRKADIAPTIQELAETNVDTLRSADLSGYEANRFVDFAKMIMIYAKGEPTPTESVTKEPAPAVPVTDELVPTEPVKTEKKMTRRNILILFGVPIVVIVLLAFLIVLMG
ncbi:MAG: helix-hairpin-helix domain-containing protein [Promethearchaeota archaeon]